MNALLCQSGLIDRIKPSRNNYLPRQTAAQIAPF
jgi:hypothetical protein